MTCPTTHIPQPISNVLAMLSPQITSHLYTTANRPSGTLTTTSALQSETLESITNTLAHSIDQHVHAPSYTKQQDL